MIIKRLRYFLVPIVVFLIQHELSAQVSVTAGFTEENGSKELRIMLVLNNGWYLYSGSADLEAPAISSSEGTVSFSPLRLLGHPQQIQDKAFGKMAMVYFDTVTMVTHVRFDEPAIHVVPFHFQGYISNGDNFIPLEKDLRIYLNQSEALKEDCAIVPVIQTDKIQLAAIGYHWFTVLLIGFFGGLIALITPCVFPMIPVTISFFGVRSTSKKQAIRSAILYGTSILAIYLLASLPFHLIGNLRPELLNNISTSVVLNLVFFFVFILFALSLFGVFQLRLPSAIANGANNKSGVGSIAGIFFLALTLVIVSFSCTGPILGTLLVGSLSGSSAAWLLTAGMAGFGIALGLPFGLFAIFPQLLSKLPRSGSWLNTVKYSLGFVELGLAFKFLSNADMVMQWGLLKREVFVGLWILLAICWVIYLLDLKKTIRHGIFRLSKGAFACIVVLISFILYLTCGLFTGNLRLMSGLVPPSFYAYHQASHSKLEANVINDYDHALQLAREQNKKLLIDFTGWACVNCRKMEEQVWTNAGVSEYIKANYILVSLYVDDKQPLPSHRKLYDYVGKTGNKRDILTYGDLHTAMEAENLGQVTQPLYAVVNPEEQLNSVPVGYTPDADLFLDWLKKSNSK